MAHPTAVLNVVGLTRSLMGAHTPHLRALAERGRVVDLVPTLPAVTCTVQASMLTGAPVREHGIVANGWYFRDIAEVRFWNRSSHLMAAQPVWAAARQRDASVTCANLFWWHNTYASADVVLNVRPMYKADGRKLPDCYSEPGDLRDELQRELGTFPLFRYWGPAADITSTRWIVDAAMHVQEQHDPTLMLVYLPHLDYPLQKWGPHDERIAGEAAAVDAEVGRLAAHLERAGRRVIVVSEYGVEAVDDAIAINQVLREAGLLRVRVEDGLELLEAGASDAFAVADHQVAHVYVKNAGQIARVSALCRATPGVDEVLDREQQATRGLDHPRSGELVLVAGHGRWFCYDYWLDEARAPDFARTVEIHRKPGFDPRELFINPAWRWPAAHVGWRLFKRNVLGLRSLLDVVPLDNRLVRGSHGRVDQQAGQGPVMILPSHVAGDVAGDVVGVAGQAVACERVREVILSSLFDDG
ncbi:MAG: nucleotide pyrophosphatase/phosphodiesterase family protein [Phycisphaeraceae bacterium]